MSQHVVGKSKKLFDGELFTLAGSTSGKVAAVTLQMKLRKWGLRTRLIQSGRYFEVWERKEPRKPKLEEIKEEAKARYAQKLKETVARKKKQGYKYWCYTPASMGIKDHKIYFRNLKSAQAWVKKHDFFGETPIYEL
jgi:hypothetical protein